RVIGGSDVFHFTSNRRKSLLPKVGLEPTPTCVDRILSPARLPFRHFGLGDCRWRSRNRCPYLLLGRGGRNKGHGGYAAVGTPPSPSALSQRGEGSNRADPATQSSTRPSGRRPSRRAPAYSSSRRSTVT